MAGMGPAPKPASQRRRNVKPTRGDWQFLPKVKYTAETVPAMPIRDDGEEWSDRCRRAWVSMWTDPSSGMWSEGDMALVELALELYDRAKESTSAAVEYRQLMDRLGVSVKGKRDHRWMVSEGDDGSMAPAPQPKAGGQAQTVSAIDDYRRRMGQA